jgi:hypothetical protein
VIIVLSAVRTSGYPTGRNRLCSGLATDLKVRGSSPFGALGKIKRGSRDDEPTLIPLSSNEIRRLLSKLVLAGRTAADHVLHWSGWRRRRQAQAKASHYHKRVNYHKSNEPPQQY